MREYDLIVPLGMACGCSQVLRAAHMQFLSLPCDWLGPSCLTPASLEHDFLNRVKLIIAGFAEALKPEDFEPMGSVPGATHKPYRNNRLGLDFLHDVPHGSDIDAAFPEMSARYARRTARLLALLRSSRRVLVLRLGRPDVSAPVPAEDLVQAQRLLAEHFRGVAFDILVLESEPGRACADCRVAEVAPGITSVCWDYRSRLPGDAVYNPDLTTLVPFLQRWCTVRDYRSAAEKKAHRRQERLRRWRALGAESWLGYQLKRLERACGR